MGKANEKFWEQLEGIVKIPKDYTPELTYIDPSDVILCYDTIEGTRKYFELKKREVVSIEFYSVGYRETQSPLVCHLEEIVKLDSVLSPKEKKWKNSMWLMFRDGEPPK
jgi:hypothetical protein